MADINQVQIRRGTTAQHALFTGAEGEVTFNTTSKRLVAHDGATLGGIPLALLSEISSASLPLAGGTLTGSLLFSLTNTCDIGASAGTRPRTGYFGTSVVSPSFVGALSGNVTGNLSGNVTGNLTGTVTGAASLNLLLTGGDLTGPLTLTQATLTGSSATTACLISSTWNTSGAPYGLRVNITNTASLFDARPFAVAVDNSDYFYLLASGDVHIKNTLQLDTIVTGSASTHSIVVSGNWNTSGNPAALFINLSNNTTGATGAFIRCDAGEDGTLFKVGHLGDVVGLNFKTSAPSGGSGAGIWKLGKYVTAFVTPPLATAYVEVEIDTVRYWLAVVQPD